MCITSASQLVSLQKAGNDSFRFWTALTLGGILETGPALHWCSAALQSS